MARRRLTGKVIWIATKGKKDTVFRKCPSASTRAKFDNVMPYVEKTELNLCRRALTEANEEIRQRDLKEIRNDSGDIND